MKERLTYRGIPLDVEYDLEYEEAEDNCSLVPLITIVSVEIPPVLPDEPRYDLTEFLDGLGEFTYPESHSGQGMHTPVFDRLVRMLEDKHGDIKSSEG